MKSLQKTEKYQGGNLGEEGSNVNKELLEGTIERLLVPSMIGVTGEPIRAGGRGRASVLLFIKMCIGLKWRSLTSPKDNIGKPYERTKYERTANINI